jgi:hypothetical protein
VLDAARRIVSPNGYRNPSPSAGRIVNPTGFGLLLEAIVDLLGPESAGAEHVFLIGDRIVAPPPKGEVNGQLFAQL